jgi:hypothetical protein
MIRVRENFREAKRINMVKYAGMIIALRACVRTKMKLKKLGGDVKVVHRNRLRHFLTLSCVLNSDQASSRARSILRDKFLTTCGNEAIYSHFIKFYEDVCFI